MTTNDRRIIDFVKNNYSYLCALIGFLIPDFMLRTLVYPMIFDEPFVTVIPTLFNLMWIFLFLSLCMMFLSKKIGRIVLGTAGVLFNVLTFSDYIYYKIFGQFFWLSSVGLVGEAGNYIDYALQYLDTYVVGITLLSLFFIILSVIGFRSRKDAPRWRKILAFLPVIGILGLHIYMQPATFGEFEDDWDSWSKPRVVYKQFTDVNKSFEVAGLYQFVARDFWKTWFPSVNYKKADYEGVTAYFEDKGKHEENPYTGIFEGKNVVAVMMESMDDWMITEKHTPVIKYMMDNGINLSNHFAPTFGSGYTFNTEFAFNTGYYTPKSAVTAVNFSTNSFPYSLPNLFAQKGYKVQSFHYNSSEFYNRGIMHKSFGYEKYNSFMEDFDMPAYAAQADSNILQNDAIYEKMTEGERFFDFVISYSGHIPYNYDDSKLSVAKKNHPDLVDPQMNEEKNNCLILARDTDDFFRQLLTRLDEDGILENTVIIGFSDHYAYGFSDIDLLQQYTVEAGSDLLQEVPAFIYTPGMEHQEITKITQSIDLLPTVANLFGLDAPNCYIGNDILDESYGGFAYFADSSWYDGQLFYIPSLTEITEANMEHVKRNAARVEKMLTVNDVVVAGDYFEEYK